jgi:hypothetical protein
MIFQCYKASIQEFDLKKLTDQFFFNQYFSNAKVLQLKIIIIFYFLVNQLFLNFINQIAQFIFYKNELVRVKLYRFDYFNLNLYSWNKYFSAKFLSMIWIHKVGFNSYYLCSCNYLTSLFLIVSHKLKKFQNYICLEWETHLNF